MMQDPGVALITGGATGIGLATARLLLSDGWKVVIADLQRPRGAFASGLAYIPADVTDPSELSSAFAEAEALGYVRAVVANAGVVEHASPIEEMSLGEWQRVMAVNATGTFLTMREGMRAMKAHGHGGALVAIASVAGLSGHPNISAYTFSKGGMVALARALAIEGAPHRIRANCVAPTAVDTSMTRGQIARSGLDPAKMDAKELEGLFAGMNPMPDPVRAADVAEAVQFLCSEAGRMITGVTLPIDAGRTTSHWGGAMEAPAPHGSR
ncbi:unnamed protein product [Pedinophyceae sp. YPF-701]|nr:unnamed protein product [Pedinophyceae sp. YPF-701]